MILHPYSHGDAYVANYYGHGFGSIFARLFSKIAAKTASRAALSAAKRVGTRLVKTGMKKVIPVAKKTMTSVVKKGMKKAVPVAKKLVKKGVKRAAEEAQNLIANKVRKVEEMAINKGVSPKLAHSVSAFVEEGSRNGIDGLIKTADTKSDRVIDQLASEASKSVGLSHTKNLISRSNRSKVHKHRIKSSRTGRNQKRKSVYQIQNLIDSA